MKNYYFMSLLVFLLVACNNTSQTEKEYIKNLEEKNAALEKELHEKKDNSQVESEESTKNSNDYFTIGSTEDEVLKIMGDPESYNDLGIFKKLYYGMSSVTIEDGKVKSYDNSDGNLKVKMRK